MKPKTKRILNILLILGTLVIVLVIGFSGKDFAKTVAAIGSFPVRWVVLCILAYLGYLFMDGFAVWYFLRRQGSPISLPYSYYIAIIGQYYSNITPGATGGQPMQVYYLRKRNIPIGLGTSALLVKLFCFQFMLLVLGTGFWLAYPQFVAENVNGSMWILIVGYVYNAVVVTALLLVAVNKNIVHFIVMGCVKIATKLHLCKDPEGAKNRWEETVDKFHASIMMLRRHPVDLMVQLLIGGGQLMVLMLVVFFLYKGFGLQGATWGQITAMGIMIYTSASYTPLPGASGAQEGVFSLYLSRIFPDNIRFVALLLWRFFTYYLSLIIGAFVTVGYGVLHGRKLSAAAREANAAREAAEKEHAEQ